MFWYVIDISNKLHNKKTDVKWGKSTKEVFELNQSSIWSLYVAMWMIVNNPLKLFSVDQVRRHDLPASRILDKVGRHTHLSYWSKKDVQLHSCNYIDATKNVFDGINKHMRVWESHIFSHVTIKPSLTHPIFCCSALFHFFWMNGLVQMNYEAKNKQHTIATDHDDLVKLVCCSILEMSYFVHVFHYNSHFVWYRNKYVL